MRRKNKNLSFAAAVLILCLMTGPGSRSVQAAVEHLDSGTAGPLHYEVTYDQDAGTLTTITVTGQGAIPDYLPTYLGSTAPWNREFDPTEGAEGNYRIGRLILGNGVTRIGNYAFAGWTYPGNLYIREMEMFPASLKSIGAYAFEGQVFGYGFGEVRIPSTVTSIGEGAFDPMITIVCHSGSQAYRFAKKNGNRVVLTDKISVGRPKKLKLKSPSKARLKITFGAVTKAKGYEIQYGTKKNYSNAVTKDVKKRSLTLKLKSRKTYYVRVRAYKLDSEGAKHYGKWSAGAKLKLK